ncbi:MAG: ATP cone domain-containing protein [Candidatus Thorarchaeota archaeon]
MVMVVKWDGRTEEFQAEKIVRTLTRMGAPQAVAEDIAEEIEETIEEGMTTKEVYNLALEALESHKEIIEFRRDLKDGLARIGTGLDFEAYVRLLLTEYGYKVSSNLVLQGACISHEIDAIAERGNETVYVEVKHHSVLERYTPFEVTLAAKAKWDDLKAGCEQGLNDCTFDRVMIVTNTRLTLHAQRYAECVGIDHFGWNIPRGRGIDWFIETKKLYPVTILRTITEEERDQLYAQRILTLKQLVQANPKELDLSEKRVTELVDETHRVFTCCQAES